MSDIDGNGLRRAFTDFFVERGHTLLPAAGLIPQDPTVLFTIAGMVQFKPYFTGELPPPVPRATTVQPCFRTVDIDVVGSTARHTTFFEMLGNFSFGDYFKERAIPLAWEFVTDRIGLDPDRLWVTVHFSDADAAGIWQDGAGVAPSRIQQMGEDNFWRMGETGPCGPCSEIYFDRGPEWGADGGPAHGGDERYVEIWNLVFMQFEQGADGSLTELPRKNIDTGAGLERVLAALQDKRSVFETDVVAPIVDAAASLIGVGLGAAPETDVALRILADHSRAMSFLVADGVFPSNDGRGYVLRRIIRRAVLRAYRHGVAELITPRLVGAVVDAMGDAYPRLEASQHLIETVVAHEEEAFRRTLRQGSALIEDVLGSHATTVPGDVAFRLHDTFGFPIDLTVEVAAERGIGVDRAGFDEQMTAQRERARAARRSGDRQGGPEQWREVLEAFGPSRFVGYERLETEARVLAVVPRDEKGLRSYEGEGAPEGTELFDLVLDVTPFYAEGGGQIGDTGTILGASGAFRVLDTTAATEGLTRHTGYFTAGALEAGVLVTASVDATRRAAIRRNHTATHLLHAALRSVLGTHVTQQGSLVAPDRLRFDFSHFSAMNPDEISEVERLVNEEVLADDGVEVSVTSRADAEAAGAMAIFGEKYGEQVRVVRAGDFSAELCGGTHVGATGMIGAFFVLSESSIGANTRRIEATTGEGTLAHLHHEDALLRRTAELVRTTPEELEGVVGRLLDRQRQLEEELRGLRGGQLRAEARQLVASASGKRIVARRDGLDSNELRELALAIRQDAGIEAVGLAGSPDGARVALVVASGKDSGIDAKAVAGEVARLVGGGGGGSGELATAGGRDVAGIGAALERLGELLGTSAS